MKRKLLIAALGAGTLIGFGSGFASMRCHRQTRRAAFEQRVARVCVEAARSVERERGNTARATPTNVPKP